MEELIKVLQETNALLSEFFHDNTMEFLALAVSVVAAIAAVYVPWKISNRQDKIALFEKRFEAYSDLLKLKSFADVIGKQDCSFKMEDLAATGKDPNSEMYRRCSEILLNFRSYFCGETESPVGNDLARTTIYRIRSLELSIHELPLLYSGQMKKDSVEASDEITGIFASLAMFMQAIISPIHPVDDKNRTDFVERVSVFFEKYADVIEKELRL